MRRIRPARIDEGQALSALCKRSKAHWGYDADFMSRSDASLNVTNEQIAGGGVLVCEDDRQVVGVVSVTPMPEKGVFDLLHLFVEPSAINTGAGRALFFAAIELLRRRGAKRLLILSDPNAAGFYRSLGAAEIGTAPSDAIPDRFLPLLEFAL